jgi:putative transposase
MIAKKPVDLAYQKGIFRFSVLSHLLSAPPKSGDLKAALREISERKHRRSWDQSEVTISLRTLERWYKLCKNAPRPTEQLQPKVRSDKHKTRQLSEDHKKWLILERHRRQSWSIQLLYDNLVEVEMKTAVPSYTTVLRYMRKNGLVQKIHSKLHRARKEVRSFEVEFVGEIFHMDFHKGKRMIIDRDGILKTPICMAIIDDKSRLACHVQWFLNETTEVLCHGLAQAILKRGLPRGFYTDNGAAMKGEELIEGLDLLGIKKSTTLPYAPYQNGKQEAFWQPLEGRLIKMLPPEKRLTLEVLNEVTQAWVEQDYHKRVHSEIKETPLHRFMNSANVLRDAPSHTEIRKAFRTTAKRTLRKNDCTIALDGVRFQIPNIYSHLNDLTLRYARWDLGEADLVEEETRKPIATLYPVDKLSNSLGLRAPRSEETNLQEEQAGNEQAGNEQVLDLRTDNLPPLLSRCLRAHAIEFPGPTYISLPKKKE